MEIEPPKNAVVLSLWVLPAAQPELPIWTSPAAAHARACIPAPRNPHTRSSWLVGCGLWSLLQQPKLLRCDSTVMQCYAEQLNDGDLAPSPQAWCWPYFEILSSSQACSDFFIYRWNKIETTCVIFFRFFLLTLLVYIHGMCTKWIRGRVIGMQTK
jgi:hypothetical protein